MAAGLRTDADHSIMRRRHAVDLLMGFFETSYADVQSRQLVLLVLARAATVPTAARHLLRRSAVVLWLRGAIVAANAPLLFCREAGGKAVDGSDGASAPGKAGSKAKEAGAVVTAEQRQLSARLTQLILMFADAWSADIDRYRHKSTGGDDGDDAAADGGAGGAAITMTSGEGMLGDEFGRAGMTLLRLVLAQSTPPAVQGVQHDGSRNNSPIPIRTKSPLPGGLSGSLSPRTRTRTLAGTTSGRANTTPEGINVSLPAFSVNGSSPGSSGGAGGANSSPRQQQHRLQTRARRAASFCESKRMRAGSFSGRSGSFSGGRGRSNSFAVAAPPPPMPPPPPPPAVPTRDIHSVLIPSLLLLLHTQRHDRLMQAAEGGGVGNASAGGSKLLQGLQPAEISHLLRRLLLGGTPSAPAAGAVAGGGDGEGAEDAATRAEAVALLLELLSSPAYPLVLEAPDSSSGGGIDGGGNNIRHVDEEWAGMLHLCVLGYKFARLHHARGCTTEPSPSSSAPSLLCRVLHWILHCVSKPLAHGLCAAIVRGGAGSTSLSMGGGLASADGGASSMFGGVNVASELVSLHYSHADQRALARDSSGLGITESTADDQAEGARQVPLFVLNSVLVTLLPHLLGMRTGYNPMQGQSREWAAVLAYSVPELLALLPLPLPLAAGLWQREGLWEGAALAQGGGAYARERASARERLAAKAMMPSFVRANEVLALLLRQLWAGQSPAQHVPLLRRLLQREQEDTEESTESSE
jgi:hypothetical protein